MWGSLVHPDDALVDRVARCAVSAYERVRGDAELEFYAVATRAFQTGSAIL